MPPSARTPIIVSPETASAVFAVGDGYTHFGVCPDQPLTETLDMAEAKFEAVTSFHTAYSQCNLQFVIPEAPPGGDKLEKLFKEACIIEDAEAAIAAVVAKGAKFLADLSLVQSLLTDHNSQLSAGIAASNEVARIVKDALSEFDAVTTELNNTMSGKAIHIDLQLAHFAQVVHARELLRVDLLSDENEIQTKREQLTDLREAAWKPYLRAASKFHLMEEMESRRRNRANTYTDRRHTSDWLPTAYSIYPSKWRKASSSSMQNARLPLHRRTAPVLSPFVILPRHIRATAPHQGHEWWNIHPGNPNAILSK